MKSLKRLLHYSFYLPYTVIIIVLHEDFQKQLQQRLTTDRMSNGRLILGAIRLIFWTGKHLADGATIDISKNNIF